jgi:iron complex outermembrane recepter protein
MASNHLSAPRMWPGRHRPRLLLGASPLAAVLALGFFREARALAAHKAQTSGDGAIPCAGVLDVHVVDAFDHMPVPDAFLVVNGSGRGTTDARGRLNITALCPGRVAVEVVHPAFENARRELEVMSTSSLEFQLQPIVESVTVTQKAAAPTDTRSTAVLSGEALEQQRGQSLSDALAEVPGVSQLRAGTGMAKPIVRGHFGRRLPILVDGVRHRAQEWGIDHAPELDPSMADRITVVRGASGVRYGSDAIGGAVLVDPPSTLDKPGAAGEGHLIGYSNGLGGSAMGRLQVAPASVPGLSLLWEGSGKRVRAPSTPDHPLDNTGERTWSAGAAASFRREGTVYQLSFRHYQAELGVCTCFRVDSADDFFAQLDRRRPLGAELYRASFEIERPYQSVAHELAVARARWTLSGLGTVSATYALQFDHRREYDVVRQATTGPQFSFRLWTHDADVVVDHMPVHVSDHLHLSGAIGLVGMIQDHDYTGLPLVPSHHAIAGGAFMSERLWGDHFEIEAGLRYDYLNRTAGIVRRDFLRLVRSGQLTVDTCGAGTEVDPVRCGSAFHTLSASIGGLLKLSSAWTAKLDLSMASRPPNADEQYLNGSAPSLPVVGLGQPDARAETSYTASGTLTYSGPRAAAELSAFGNYISDYLSFAPAVASDGKPVFDVLIRGTFPRFVTRGVDALFYGADGFVSATPVSWLQLGAQASLVRARNVTDGRHLVFIPPDRLRTSLAFTPARSLFGLEKVTAAVAGTYAFRQSRFDPGADLAPPPDGHFVLEASLGAQRRMGGQVVKFALAGTNLLGARYREYPSLLRYFADQPTRQLFFRITMLYDSNQSS